MRLRAPEDCGDHALAFTLADGRVAQLRPIGPEDAALHLAAMRELSAEARQARFLDAGFAPSASVSRYLTAVDQSDHVAWGATLQTAEGVLGIGVVRFVRSDSAADEAELAVTVVDAFQGLGLGRALLRLGLRLARRHGIQRLTGLLREDNHRMLALVRRLGAELRPVGNGLVAARIELEPRRRD